MQRKRQPLPCSTARPRARLTVLALMLTVLAGCATGGKVEPEAVDKGFAAGASVEAGPSVARLTDGREGFIIRETPHMDGETRRDFERATAMLDSGDYGQAITLLEKVIAQEPGVTAPYIDIAMAYRQLDKTDEAEKHLKTALGLVPDHPVASNEYGLLLRKAGRFAEARAVYEKALASFPEYLPVRRNFGILCDLYLNDLQCALEQYEIFSKAMPGDEQVKLWIADLNLRLGSQ